MNQDNADEIASLARRIRIGTITSIYHAGSGHPGGSLSCADILAVWFVHRRTHHDDIFILSKGHAAPALYAAYAAEGWMPESRLNTLRKLGSLLQGHPDATMIPQVEVSTGSLGQGFSFAIGAALAMKHRGLPGRVYVLLGDGECQEGSVWEGAMAAAQYKLGNLTAIIDRNRAQSDSWTEDTMSLEPLRERWMAFGWNTTTENGHDCDSLTYLMGVEFKRDLPFLVIADTLKGKGVSYMEGSLQWHGSVRMTLEETTVALKDLEVCDSEIDALLDSAHRSG